MANGFLVVDEKDWNELTPDRRDWLIFNTLKKMDARLKSLEKWGWLKVTAMFLGAMTGGAMTTFILHICKVKPI